MPQQAVAKPFAIPQRLPLVTELSNRDTTFSKDSKLINCYIEPDRVKGEYWLTKRPGYVTTYSKTPGGGYGLWSYSDDNGASNFTIIGNTFYLDNSGLGLHTSYTLAASSGGTYRFQQITPASSATKYWVVGNGDKSYYGTSSITLPTAITDINFPTNLVKGWAVLDGTTYIMTVGASIYGSKNLNDPTVWDAANVIQASDDSDSGVYLTKQLTYVVAIKQWTTQFFYDAGNAVGSPLGKVPGSTLSFGCISSETVQGIDDILLWVTYNRSPSPQVVLLQNLQPKIVSTPEVDKLLSTVNSVSPGRAVWYSFCFKQSGHRFYGISLVDVTDGAPNFTLVLDIDTGLWYIWQDSAGKYIPWIGFNSLNVAFQNPITGVVYGVDQAIYNDNNALINVDIYTPNYDGGVDRKKTLSMMRFNADQTNGSVLQVRHSEDDYQTWSNFRKADLSVKRPFLENCGTFRRTAYHMRHSCNTPFRIKSVDMQIALGSA